MVINIILSVISIPIALFAMDVCGSDYVPDQNVSQEMIEPNLWKDIVILCAIQPAYPVRTPHDVVLPSWFPQLLDS